MNNTVFGKTMENVRKHRDIKLITTDKKRSELASKFNYYTIKWFLEILLAIEMKKIKVKINKPIYLGFSILEISKIIMYEFWYDYMKPKYKRKAKLCMQTQIVLLLILKTKIFTKIFLMMLITDLTHQIMNPIRPLPIGTNKREIGLMKDELGGKIMKKSVDIRAKIYSFLMDEGREIKK